ncbi:MAG: deoxyribose-phosphate aldolase [Thermoprotei archaeon]|nr:MAG: deoxyribose-phosphate aldolase [Thermoprotei archaeon]RLE56814.1 MAG: deoxyribose-phosphate aldolase [Thermoprotei archaeon]
MRIIELLLGLQRVKEVWSNLPKVVDHTLLDPSAPLDVVVKECERVKEYGFRAFCISPHHVPHVVKLLKGSGVRICTVVGFPHGYQITDVKIFEARKYMELGADDIDMVINVQALKSGEWKYIEEEVRAVAEVVHSYGGILKVIIETGYLSDEEKERVAQVLSRAGADFVKTCTGFGPGRATVHDVSLLAQVAHSRGLKVKAAGGIRHLEDALTLVAAGADVLGSSAGVRIVDEWKTAKQKVKL